MGTMMYFDEMLPATDSAARRGKNSRRQVEIYTWGNRLWLRVGTQNRRDTGGGFCVEISHGDAVALQETLEGGSQYLWGAYPHALATYEGKLPVMPERGPGTVA